MWDFLIGLFGKILVWNLNSWFLQIIDQKFGERWSFFRLLKIIMKYFWVVRGISGGLRPPAPPAAAQGLSRSRGRGVHDKTEATWFIKCCILKKFWSQSSLMKGFSCLWAIITCIFKLLFLENFLSQNSHSKCFFFYEQKQHGSKSYSF